MSLRQTTYRYLLFPTLIGTGAYTYATTLGSLSIAGGVCAMMVGTAVGALNLQRPQYAGEVATLCLLSGPRCCPMGLIVKRVIDVRINTFPRL